MHQGSPSSLLLFVIVMEALSREFRVALPWEFLSADVLFVIAETEHDLIKGHNEWKDFVENRGMRVNMKTKVMITGERQKAGRRPYGVCGRGVVIIQHSVHCTSWRYATLVVVLWRLALLVSSLLSSPSASVTAVRQEPLNVHVYFWCEYSS